MKNTRPSQAFAIRINKTGYWFIAKNIHENVCEILFDISLSQQTKTIHFKIKIKMFLVYLITNVLSVTKKKK